MNGLKRRKAQRLGVPAERGFWSPLTELSRLRDELEWLALPGGLLTPTSFFEGWTPSVDLYEDKDKFVVRAEIPGMKKEDIDVSVEGNTLTISGEKKSEHEEREEGTYRSERYFGRFQRTVTLPESVDPEKIEAHYKDGVLTLTVPKSEEAKPKHIEVKEA